MVVTDLLLAITDPHQLSINLCTAVVILDHADCLEWLNAFDFELYGSITEYISSNANQLVQMIVLCMHG